MARKKTEYPVTTQPEERHQATCPWNDHGVICGEVGSLSDSTNGQGPWYCTTHYWQLKGRSGVVDDRYRGPSPAPCNYPGCKNEGVAGKNPFYCLNHYGNTGGSYRRDWYGQRDIPYEPPNAGNLAKRMRQPGED